MDLAVQIFQIIFFSIGALFMITFSIIGIWSFILFNKYYENKRIQNYILEKIYQSINQLTYKNSSLNESSDDDLLSIDNLFEDEENN